MAQLELIHSSATSQTSPNVVFLHGLGGHARKTWMCNPEDDATLWPKWVGEDADCIIWVLGYDASLSSWTNGAMPLPDQGSAVLDLLVNEPELSKRPLVLVGHSMGGLVIKTAIAHAMTHGVKRYEEFAKKLCGIDLLQLLISVLILPILRVRLRSCYALMNKLAI
ncbi:MAG TPA: alpha/beta hydrolase [Gallionella sp.]|nr:alpha/beta hydrolase [Gallionella sp.]